MIRKFSFICICFPCLLFFFSCSNKNISYPLNTIFVGDSGYLSIEDMMLIKPDIDLDRLHYLLSGDSITGKYMKDKKAGRYIAVLIAYDTVEWDTNTLVSFNPSDGTFDVGESLSSFWSSAGAIANSLRAEGDYYYVETVIGHGTAFGASGFYLFKDIHNIGSPIYSSIYSGGIDAQYSSLCTNSMQIIGGDTLRISYQLEDGVFDEDYENTKTLLEKEWVIDYVRKNGDWAATDSTLFEEKDMLFM